MNVYKHYNQEQLNDQYNTRLQVPDYAGYFDRWERLSRQTAKQNTILKDISFGDSSGRTPGYFSFKNSSFQNTGLYTWRILAPARQDYVSFPGRAFPEV